MAENDCSFDVVIKAICPYCLNKMEISDKNKTHCPTCDFSWEDEV